MSFLKNKKRVIESSDNNVQEETGTNVNQQEETVFQEETETNIVEEQIETQVESPKANVAKKPQMNADKKKKIIVGAVGAVVVAGVLFNMDSETEQPNNNGGTNSVQKAQIEQKEIKFTDDLNVLEASKDKDFISRLKYLEDNILGNKNFVKDGMTETDIKKIKKIKFDSYYELSKLLFTKKYKISNNEYLYRQGENVYHHLFQGNELNLEGIAPIPMPNGAFVRIEQLDMDYIIINSNKQDTNFQSIKDINVWRIDPSLGLKKILSFNTIKDVLSYLNQDEPKEEVFVKKYLNKILLIGDNAEIKDILDYFAEAEDEIETPKDIIMQYSLVEYTDENFKKIKLENNTIFSNDKQLFKEAGLYNIKYMKYNDEEEGIKEKVFIFKNNRIIKQVDLMNIRNISLNNYKNGSGEEFVSKEGMIFQLNANTGALEEIGSGSIYGKIQNGQLDSISLSIIESTEEKMPITNMIGKILIDTNGIEYKVTEDGVYYQGSIYPVNTFTITGSGFLFYLEEKVAKIKEIKSITKSGAALTTTKYKINLYSENKYEISNLDNELLYDQNTFEKIEFKIDFEAEEVTAIAHKRIEIDTKNKTINGIKYDTYEERGDAFFLFNNEGTLIKEVKTLNIEELFKDKIINFELIDGDLFDYYFNVDKLEGRIENSKIGKILKKYNTNTIPFKQFLNKNKNAVTKILDTKLKSQYGNSTVFLLSDLLKDKTFPFISFENNEKKMSIKMLDEKTLTINGKDEVLSEKIYLNIAKNKFMLQSSKGEVDNRLLQKYKLLVKDKALNLFYNEMKLDDKNYIDKTNNIKLFKYNNVYYFKNATSPDYYEVLTIDIDLLKNQLKIVDIKDNTFFTPLSSMEEMNSREYETYDKLLKIYLTPKVDEDMIAKRKAEEEEKQRRIRMSKEFQEKIAEFEKTPIKPVSIELNQKVIKEIKEKNTAPDFTFEIGTKLKFTIPESMEVVEGQKGFSLGYINHLNLKDLSGNDITIKNANVVLELEGDFSKQKINVYPLKIIYKDNETNEKRVIDIPKKATQFKYKEDGYEQVGIPAYVINAKLKNINTTVILSTVSGILENLTTPEDSITSLVESQTSAATGVSDDSSQTLGEATASGINEGIQDLIATIKESAENEKNLLIAEPNIKGESLFIEEVEVKFDAQKNTK